MKENFYWIQMYKLASATRGDRALIDNTGPWLTVTPWPNAWWNLNVQLTYWALNASNHLDLAASLENAFTSCPQFLNGYFRFYLRCRVKRVVFRHLYPFSFSFCIKISRALGGGGSDLFAIPRLLTGHFALHPEGTIVNGTMHLDIWNAEDTNELR